MRAGTQEAAGESSRIADTSSPCGPALDWSSDPDVALLDAEIEKSTATPRGQVNWSLVLQEAESLLQKSTDWVLVCVAARASISVRGVSALPTAIESLTSAARRSWTQMHPALPRGLIRRARYLEWFESGVAEQLRSVKIRRTNQSDAHLQASLESLAILDETLLGLMGRPPYPGVRRLREELERATEASVAAEPPAIPRRSEESPTPAGLDAEPRVTVAEFPPPIDSLDGAEQVLYKTRDALIAVASALQKFDAADAQSFRLRRTGAWIRVGAVESPHGRLLVPGPTADEADKLRKALDTDPLDALEQAEHYLTVHPLWLDVNYVAFLALTLIGRRHGGGAASAYDAIGDAIRIETLGLLKRVPGLLDLEFKNGTPVAAPDTRNWLEHDASQPTASTATGNLTTSAVEASDPLVDAERAANQLAVQGNLLESFRVLDDSIREATTGRERFRRRLAASRHAARHGRLDVSIDLLDGLDREATELNLERWEPELCADVLTALLSVGAKDGRQQPERLRAEVLKRRPDAVARLARLELMTALRLIGERY